MIPYTPPVAAEFIPVIDLADSFSDDLDKRKAVAHEIHKACRDTGFFYIKNHGIAAELTDKHLDVARQFFELPLQEKMKSDGTNAESMRGYEPMGLQVLDEGTPQDLKEGFQMGIEVTEDHRWYKAGMGKTAINIWPDQPEGFREHFENYSAGMIELARHLMRMIALSLELDEDYFDTDMMTPMLETRILHYPPHPANADPNQLGAGAHTDWGVLTILLQDDVGGLEVRNADGVWISAPPIDGTFVVNLGDMIPILTNGIYHSNMHRVLNNSSGRDRYSAPTFVDPDFETRIKCVPTCLPDSGAPKYPETTIGQHVQAMFEKTYGKAG
ncbi:hypothetical protein KUW09_12205 [Mameliella alba]|nr:hypothetical protein [Mameliella alba]MCA0956448.1 hypothetical protein [Mameliella alba]